MAESWKKRPNTHKTYTHAHTPFEVSSMLTGWYFLIIDTRVPTKFRPRREVARQECGLRA